jgi:hypothetical protein
MRARVSVVSILFGLISTTAVAHAQDAPPPAFLPGSGQIASAESHVTVRESYAWQVILVDAASVALVLSLQEKPLMLGLSGFALGAPLIHAMHGNPGSAIASAGLRVGLPWLGFKAGTASYEPQENDGLEMAVLPGLALGAIGVISAVVIDWGFLSWDEQRVPVTTGRSLVVVPQVGVSEQGVSLGVLGRF